MNIGIFAPVLTFILHYAFMFSGGDDGALAVFNDFQSHYVVLCEDATFTIHRLIDRGQELAPIIFGSPPPRVIDIPDELRNLYEHQPSWENKLSESGKLERSLLQVDFSQTFYPPELAVAESEASLVVAPPPKAEAVSTSQERSYLHVYICLSIVLVQPLAYLYGFLNDPSRRESSRTTANGRENRKSRSRRRKYSNGSDTQADLEVDSDEFTRQFVAFMRQWGPSLSTKLQDYNQHASISPDVVAMYAAPSQRHNVAIHDVGNKAYQTEHFSPNLVLSSRGQEDWRSKTVFDEGFGDPSVPPSYMSAAGSAGELDGNGTSLSPKATGSGLVPRRCIDTPKPPRVRFGINLFYIQDGSESIETPAKTTVSHSHGTCARDGDILAENAEISKIIDAKVEDDAPEESEQLLESPFAVHSSTRVGPDSSWQNETPRPLRIQRDVFYTIPKKSIEIQPRESRWGTDAQDTVQSDRGILDSHTDSTRRASRDDAPGFRILSRPSLLRTPERVYLLESPLVSKNYSAFPSMLGQEPRKESVLVSRLQVTKKRRGDEDDRDAVHDIHSRSVTSRRQHIDENDGRQRDSSQLFGQVELTLQTFKSMAPIDERLQVEPFSRDRSRPRTSRNGRTDKLQRVSHERMQEEPDLRKTLRPRTSHNRRTDKIEDTQRVSLPIDERRHIELARRDCHYEAPTVYSMGPAREPAHGVFRTSKTHSRSSPVKSREPEPELSCRCPGGDPFCYERAPMEWFHSTPIRSHYHDTLCRDMKMTKTVKRIEKKWLKSDTGLYQSSHFMRDGRPRFKFV
ncbi:hypothetical protein ACEPAI_3529 [Sanghuangporus weigelae]